MQAELVTVFIFLLGSLAFFAVMYPLSETKVEVAHERLILRWRVLRYLPFARRTIPLERIVDVRLYGRRDWKLPVEFFGGAFRPRSHVAIVVRSRWFGITHGYIIAQRSPDGLIQSLRSSVMSAQARWASNG